MIKTIARLRTIGDVTAERARTGDQAREIRSEMLDLASKLHWLAGEAARLCSKSRELDGADAACTGCGEGCLSTVTRR